MDIFDFFWSKDVAVHCQKAGHVFSPVEMAAIVAVSDKPIFAQHKAWKHIMKHFPDMPIPVGPDSGGEESDNKVSLRAHLKERMRRESRIVREYHDFGDEFVYVPKCMPDMRKAEHIDFAEDYPVSFYRFLNGYTLDRYPTTQQAWEALSKEWKNEGLRSASIRKEHYDSEWKMWVCDIEMNVNENGKFMSFHLGRSDDSDMDNPYLLETCFRRDVVDRIPTPFEVGDILEEVTSPGEPYVLAKHPCGEDRGERYSIEKHDGSLDFDPCVSELYYAQYSRQVLRGRQRFLNYLSRYLKNGEFRLDELINLFCLTREMSEKTDAAKPSKPRPHKELMSLPLPKYGQMLITGKPVSPEQALEIIYRTDYVHSFGMYDFESIPFDDYAEHGVIHAWHARMNWFDAYHTIDECGWGWLRPDGQILYDGNFSKNAEVSEVYNDWRRVAGAFPFLEVNITLFNDQAGTEAKPIWRMSDYLGEYAGAEFGPMVSMRVRNGKVKLVDPLFEDVHENDELPTRACVIPTGLADPRNPKILSIDKLAEWFEARMGRHGGT